MANDNSLLASAWNAFGIAYHPQPEERPFLERAQTQAAGGIEVSLAVLDGPESLAFFGRPLAKRSLQPVWIRIRNREKSPVRFMRLSLGASYYTPLEAAAACHYKSGKQLLGVGALAWFFLPALLLLPIRFVRAWLANRRVDEHFMRHALPLRMVPPGGESSGFVFTPLDVGTKVLQPRFLGPDGQVELNFEVKVAGLDADWLRRELNPPQESEPLECSVGELAKRLRALPRATTNAKGTGGGDPVNLVVIGEFATILGAFGARWDETETITLATSLKTATSFLAGKEYRYSPVSPLFLFGRSQDFALQRIRESINERLHLRLWKTPLRRNGKPVWVGQVSRDIGVRFTWKTWNLTTHRIDPDVDESRDYVVEDLLAAERLEVATYVDGVGQCTAEAPQRNLTGDPWYTDGQRAVIAVADRPTPPRFVSWEHETS